MHFWKKLISWSFSSTDIISYCTKYSESFSFPEIGLTFNKFFKSRRTTYLHMLSRIAACSRGSHNQLKDKIFSIIIPTRIYYYHFLLYNFLTLEQLMRNVYFAICYYSHLLLLKFNPVMFYDTYYSDMLIKSDKSIYLCIFYPKKIWYLMFFLETKLSLRLQRLKSF